MIARRTSLFCAAAISGAIASSASAADWSAEPALSFGADVDDNRRLVENATTTHAARLTADLSLSRQTETRKLLLRPRVESRRYDGADEALNSTDVGVDLLYHSRGERMDWQWQATARDDGTLTSELADTGIVEDSATRRTLTGSVNSTWRIGERSELQVGASWLDVGFDEARGTGLTAYRYPGALVGFARDTGARSRLSLTVNAARLEVPHSGVRVDHRALEARWRTSLTERLSLELTGGMRRVENAINADQGAVFSVSGDWSNERSSWNLTLARDVDPSALGRMMEVDSIAGGWSWQTGEQSRLSLSIRHQRRADLLFGILPERREYTTAYAAMKWRLDEHWNLELRGSAARQAYELLDFDAAGRKLEMVISWSPRRFSLAR